MSKAKIISRRSEENIMGEKNILSKIHHPFIVNIYFSFQDYDNLYLLMDLLTGGDLRYHLTHKKPCVFNENQTKFFISNIILALEYLHSQKIIHRDIKPENLVLDINGYVRLTDFGIAIINKDDNNIKESSGTAGYMAPEVMLQQGHSYPADFFALGVIGYEFMIGNRPYYGKNSKQIKEFILSYQAKIKYNNKKKGWSENSKDFINRLLQRRPIKRLGYSGIKELKNHLWLKDIDWDLLKKKKIKAPYLPKEGKEYFDKKYCQDEKTNEKYKNLININGYQHAFENYTFININYITKLNKDYSQNINSNFNENELNSMRQLSFSVSLVKEKSFSASKNITNNIRFKINKNFSTNKLSKTIKRNNNIKENKNLALNKDNNMYKSTNQLIKRYYNIGIPKEKDEDKNNEKNIKKVKIEKIIEKNKKKQLNKHCFSSDNLIKQKKQININNINKLIDKNNVISPIVKINKNPQNNNNNNNNKTNKRHINFKSSKSSQSLLKKPKTNRIMLNDQKSMINNEKEKEILFNSTTKEKTTDNKDKTFIKIKDKKKKKDIKNIKGNIKISNKKKIEESNIRNKDSFFQSNYFLNNETKNSLIHSRNNINNKESPKTKENSKTFIKNNKINNIDNDDYHIKVIHKKVYKMRNNKNDKNKNFTNYKSIKENNSIKNISLIRNQSINNNNYKTINPFLIQKNNLKSKKNLSNLTKSKKFDGTRSKKIFNSKGFIEFKKRKINNSKVNPKEHKSLSNKNIVKLKKENKGKKINKEIKENNINKENDKTGVLKFDDYFRNTGLDKESSKNNYYILDKFVSI